MRIRYPSINSGRTVLVAAALSLLLITACLASTDNDQGPRLAVPTPVDPDRTSIRSFKFFERADFGDANFSALLPDGWEAVDTLSGPLLGLKDPPSGILAKHGNTRLQVHYEVTPPHTASNSVLSRGQSENYLPEQSVIDGVTVDWVLPIDPMASERTVRMEANFSSLPGDPEQLFGLNVVAHGIDPVLLDEVKQVIESFRFAPAPALRNQPTPRVRPAEDWERVRAHWGGIQFADFSVLAPPGTTFETVPTLDTLGGRFKMGEVEIFVEFATASSAPIAADGHIRLTNRAEQEVWVEVIHGKPFIFYRPAEVHPTGKVMTGVSVARIPGLPDLVIVDGRYSTTMLSCGGHFISEATDRGEQELVLAVLRTITTETQSHVCS